MSGYSERLDQTIPCALDHRVVQAIKKIAINNQQIKMIKVFRNELFAISERGDQWLRNIQHFSRIVHDYSDNKGFIIWKDQLEEKLF